MSNGPEHYRAAARLLEDAQKLSSGNPAVFATIVEASKAHAELARISLLVDVELVNSSDASGEARIQAWIEATA